jgi:hypothetical protein
MYDLDTKREQNDAALTYLDTGTLALADILAAIDDGPAEVVTLNVGRNLRPPRRALRLARWGAGFAVVAVAGAVGGLLLAPSASAASPFDNPLYVAVHASNNWQCSSPARLEQSCISLDGTVHSEVVAEVGTDETTFEATITSKDKIVRTEITAFAPGADEAADVAGLRNAMRSNPASYPNVREGVGWLLWSTDKYSADHVESVLTARPSTAP